MPLQGSLPPDNPASTLQEFFIKSRSVSFLSTDFSQVETAAFAPFLEEYLQDYQEVESLEEAFLFMSRWQILATHVEGKMGVEFFNELLLRRAIALGKQALYLPIIWTKNDYVKHLYNGMAGIWIRYKNSPEKDQIVFPGEEAPQHLLGKISPKKAPYSLGFCLSVHKSQGSEFDRVLLSLGEGSEVFGKKLLYSAATRAKKKLHILGLKSTFTKTLAEDHWRDSQIGKRLLDFQG
ncbi:MAG: ATP-dependent RecD-like DNA helicase [Chlamydiota bacterium]